MVFGQREKLDGIADIERQQLQKPEVKFDAKYCGGHNGYPVRKEIKVKFTVFAKRMEITSDRFRFPVRFDQVTGIRNLHQKKIYTIIVYNDGMEEQARIFDFGKHLEKKQPIIYQKMIASRLERESAAHERGATQRASSSLSASPDSGIDSKVLGNDFAINTDNSPLSDSTKNVFLDTSQLGQFIPLAPTDAVTTNREDSDEEDIEEINYEND